MVGPATAGGDLEGIIRLPAPVTSAIFTLFALAVLVFLVGLARRVRIRRRGEGEDELDPEAPPVPPWMRTVTQILSLANVLVIAYLCWRGVIPLADLLSLGYGAGSASGSAPAQAPASAPLLVNWTFGTLAVLAGLGALALALWIGFSDRLAAWWEQAADDASPAPATAVERSLEDPRAERDPRRAIMRCYARFERVAADSGVTRQPWHTPMEFMREALRRLPAPREAVPALTGLFELARFSHRALGPTERERALGALDEITSAVEERRTDAATP